MEDDMIDFFVAIFILWLLPDQTKKTDPDELLPYIHDHSHYNDGGGAGSVE